MRKKVSDFILQADFALKEGDRAVLIGALSSGKTALLKWVFGLTSLSSEEESGKVWVNDLEVSQLHPEARKIAYIFQDPVLFPTLNVLDNATFGLRVRGVAPLERIMMGKEWLAKVGLAEKAEKKVRELSRGEIQRVNLIRAFIWHPEIVLLDAPFSDLEKSERADLTQYLLKIQAERKTPLLIASEKPEDVQLMGNRHFEMSALSPTRAREVREIFH